VIYETLDAPEEYLPQWACEYLSGYSSRQCPPMLKWISDHFRSLHEFNRVKINFYYPDLTRCSQFASAIRRKLFAPRQATAFISNVFEASDS
jgi:hypothetical protein